eukprot:XP_011667751.1 PREDICTED: uncharacterized protein LOC589300 [Strongylocentrotus purpuratus]
MAMGILVVDIGCGELKVVRLLKFHRYIHELIGLDVDGDLLKQHSYLINPLASSYLHPLPHPLVISLLHGSITERDSRLLNSDLVVCVEVIEHLYPEDLSEATKVIFGYMKPTRAVFTTPNAEFNVLFPGFQGFRHDDHKFEWTRHEFQEWGNAICSEYGYRVEYSGLGTGPEGSEHLGFCTQVAILDRISPSKDCLAESTDEDLQMMPYAEVARVEYFIKQLSNEDIVAEAELRVRQVLKNAQRMMDDEEGVFDNASEEEDDDTVRKWMENSLAARARERQEWERAGQSGVGEGAGGGGGSSRTAAENSRSDSFTRAMEETKDTLQSTSVCHFKNKVIKIDPGDRMDEKNLCDTLPFSCQKSQEACSKDVSDLPNVLDAVSLNLRDDEPIVQRQDDACPESSTTIHHSIDSIAKEQCMGRTDSENITVGNVLDSEECAYVLGRQSKSFSAREVEDGNSFFEQWEKGFPERELSYDLEELKISISLERLMRFQTLQEMCPNITKLREVLLASGKFQFSSNGGAVIADLYADNDSSDSELWKAGSDGDCGDSDTHSVDSQGDTGDGKLPGVGDIIEEEECWD